MENHDLPPDLHELERDLAGRPRPVPPAALRQRVIGCVRAELRRNGSRNGWTFAAGVAAAVLVWVNLSLSATLATDFGPQPDRPRRPVEKVAAEIQRLLPGLSDEEARRQAILLQAGSDLRGRPTFSAGRGALRQFDELEDILREGG